MEVHSGFLVYVHDVCSKSFDLWYEFLWFYNHEVYVKWFAGDACHCFHNGESEGDIGDENSVHDIKVIPVAVAPIEQAYVALKVAEVCGEQRRGD